MTKEQKKLLDLMIEFDSFCAENGIVYYLSGQTLLYGICRGETVPLPSHASVIMTADNCKKFISAFNVASVTDRELEYWGNSPDYPDYTVRYVASDTTAFNMMDYLNYRAHGMYVEVQILRGEDRSYMSRRMRTVERGMSINAVRENSREDVIRGDKDRKADKYYRAVALLGKGRIRKSVFGYFITRCADPVKSGTGEECFYSLPGKSKRILNVSRNLFSGTARICSIEGHEFPVPAEAEKLLMRTDKTRYERMTAGEAVKVRRLDTDSHVIDAERGYRETIESMGLREEQFMEIHRTTEAFNKIEKQKQKPKSVTQNAWQLIQKVDEGFRMVKLTEPLKQEILQRHAENDYDGLRELMRGFEEEFGGLLSEGKCFSFDDEVFDAYTDLLKHEGRADEAERILEHLPV